MAAKGQVTSETASDSSATAALISKNNDSFLEGLRNHKELNKEALRSVLSVILPEAMEKCVAHTISTSVNEATASIVVPAVLEAIRSLGIKQSGAFLPGEIKMKRYAGNELKWEPNVGASHFNLTGTYKFSIEDFQPYTGTTVALKAIKEKL